MEVHEPTPYVEDAFREVADKYGTAREELESAEDEELLALFSSFDDDLGELKHEEFAVYSSVRGILYDRGYRLRDGAWV